MISFSFPEADLIPPPDFCCAAGLLAQRSYAHVGFAFALLAELHGSVHECEQRVILAQMCIRDRAEAYPGPSLVIAYAPCINHGIKGGMTRTQTVGKEAVACGYWHLWHYNPELAEQGKNPFVLDSKEPDWSKFREFLMKEVRYTSLLKTFPAEAEELFEAAEENAKWRYAGYQRLSKMEY